MKIILSTKNNVGVLNDARTSPKNDSNSTGYDPVFRIAVDAGYKGWSRGTSRSYIYKRSALKTVLGGRKRKLCWKITLTKGIPLRAEGEKGGHFSQLWVGGGSSWTGWKKQEGPAGGLVFGGPNKREGTIKKNWGHWGKKNRNTDGRLGEDTHSTVPRERLITKKRVRKWRWPWGGETSRRKKFIKNEIQEKKGKGPLGGWVSEKHSRGTPGFFKASITKIKDSCEGKRSRGEKLGQAKKTHKHFEREQMGWLGGEGGTSR